MKDDKIVFPEIKPGIEIKIIDSGKVIDWESLCELTMCRILDECKSCAFWDEDNFEKWQEQCKELEDVF